MERLDVAVAGEAEVDDAVCEQPAVRWFWRSELNGSVPAGGAVAAAGHARLDHDRAAELLGAGA